MCVCAAFLSLFISVCVFPASYAQAIWPYMHLYVFLYTHCVILAADTGKKKHHREINQYIQVRLAMAPLFTSTSCTTEIKIEQEHAENTHFDKR